MRGQWSRARFVAVMLGGVAGAGLRWAVLASAPPDRGFPWPVLVINVTGSVLLGVLLAHEPTHTALRTLLHDAGAIGFCGGLTTFSTFALEVVDLVRADDATIALLYAAMSVFGTTAGVVAGAAAFRQVRAVTLPLEEEP